MIILFSVLKFLFSFLISDFEKIKIILLFNAVFQENTNLGMIQYFFIF